MKSAIRHRLEGIDNKASAIGRRPESIVEEALVKLDDVDDCASIEMIEMIERLNLCGFKAESQLNAIHTDAICAIIIGFDRERRQPGCP